MNKAFININIFYNILFKTSLTSKARKLLEDYEDNKFYTSLTAVKNYSTHPRGNTTKSIEDIRGPYSLRKLITSKGYPEIIISGIRKLPEDLEVNVPVENVEYQDMIEIANQLKLLPSNTIIALTCKHNNIDVIISFDEDFKRIPWLKVIP